MKTYILGYIDTEYTDFEDPSDLTRFKTEKQADELSDEWCAVRALSLPEARSKYHQSFKEWQQSPSLKN